jgi:hypothetical protein
LIRIFLFDIDTTKCSYKVFEQNNIDREVFNFVYRNLNAIRIYGTKKSFSRKEFLEIYRPIVYGGINNERLRSPV